jgi:hypothetical protein
MLVMLHWFLPSVMPSSCLKEERCDTLMEDDAEIHSRFAVDGSIVAYRDRDSL